MSARLARARRARPAPLALSALLAMGGLLACLVACSPARLPTSVGHPLEGEEAPHFQVPSTLDEEEVGIPGGGGTRVTVVDFWASWCRGCRQSLPALEHLYQDRKRAGVLVIGISLDEEESHARALAEETGISFPMVHDPFMRLARAYRAYSIPLTFVVDHAGVVRWAGRDPTRVRAAVDVLLAEPRAEAR
jgi:cytochrome c biogenesis protein CcmG, thiol:disulfide interchange protein DsbE